MYRTSVFIKQYYGGKILETVPVLTLNWYYCAPLDFGLRVPVSPGHLVFSQVPGYFVYRYIRTAIRYKSQVLYLQVPVCKHRNVYRCLQIYKRPVTRPLVVLVLTLYVLVPVRIYRLISEPLCCVTYVFVPES